MRHLFQFFTFCTMLFMFSSCTSTKELTISTIEPSPVDFSNQVRKIGIVNSSKSSFVKSYSTRLEQLIVMEEMWLAEKGTEAALSGLFDELVQDERFDTVRILNNLTHESVDFGTKPSLDTWKRIAAICEDKGVDALFSLASHDTETQFTLKKTKMEQNDMIRDRSRVAAQEITLETLIENGWRIYDPKQKLVIDEFTSNEQITASAKGISSIDALQAIDKRRETLLEQSKSSGSSYGQRMLPQKLNIQRKYYVKGTRNFVLAGAEIQKGAYDTAIGLWEEEITNPKTRISAKACFNIAVLNEYKGYINEAFNWATKSYALHEDDATLDYLMALEGRQAQFDVLKSQLASIDLEE